MGEVIHKGKPYYDGIDAQTQVLCTGDILPLCHPSTRYKWADVTCRSCKKFQKKPKAKNSIYTAWQEGAK